MDRILIVGGPKSGKSTLANKLAEELNVAHHCTDPQCLCDDGVVGVPNDLGWSEASEFVADYWIGEMPIIEGVGVPRCLRKYMKTSKDLPCEKIIRIYGSYIPLEKGQQSMAKSVNTVMDEVLKNHPELKEITEEIFL